MSEKAMTENKTAVDYDARFRERMRKFWEGVHEGCRQESEAGRGPFILTPEGRAWLKEYQKKVARKP